MVLFNRMKSCTVSELENGLLDAKGVFIDSFHEINLNFHVNPSDMQIVWAKCDMVRIPHADCGEAENQAGRLVGIKVGPGARKAIQEAVGHSLGCTHLADLALEAVKAVVQAGFKMARRKLTREQLNANYTKQLEGTCYHWTVNAEDKSLRGVSK